MSKNISKYVAILVGVAFLGWCVNKVIGFVALLLFVACLVGVAGFVIFLNKFINKNKPKSP